MFQFSRPIVSVAVAVFFVASHSPASPQAQPQSPPAQRPVQGQGQAQAQPPRQNPRAQVPMDPERARQLYVSKDPAHQSLGTDYQADIAAREKTAARYPELCKGIIDFSIVKYRSSVGDMDIPAYLFQPLNKRGPKGHAAMVWVHGGVHGNWGITMFPFVKEAVARGYVIIAPDYRGSTGYGEAHHQAIDYGGKEVDDVISARGLPEDAAARRPGARRHHGLEPRRLHHAALASSARSTRSRPARRSSR